MILCKFLLFFIWLNKIRMVDKFINSFSLAFFILKTITHEEQAFNCYQTQISFFKMIFSRLQFLFEPFSILGMKWCFTMKKFKQYYSNRPCVRFVRIVFAIIDLRSHVQWCSTQRLNILFLDLEFNWEPKVSNLDMKWSRKEIKSV